MKLNKEYKKLLTLVMLSLIALFIIYASISFMQLTFNFVDWLTISRVALIVFWVIFTIFTGINLYSEDD